MTNHEIIMLLDIYGSTLTDKQYECMDLHYNEDLTLSEIAEQLGITRQAVHDMIKRCQIALKEMEDKLGFMARFVSQIAIARELKNELESLKPKENNEICISEEKMQKLIDMVHKMIDGEKS